MTGRWRKSQDVGNHVSRVGARAAQKTRALPPVPISAKLWITVLLSLQRAMVLNLVLPRARISAMPCKVPRRDTTRT